MVGTWVRMALRMDSECLGHTGVVSKSLALGPAGKSQLNDNACVRHFCALPRPSPDGALSPQLSYPRGNLPDDTLLWAALPSPTEISYSLASVSWDHFPKELFTFESLSRGLFPGGPRLQESLNFPFFSPLPKSGLYWTQTPRGNLSALWP